MVFIKCKIITTEQDLNSLNNDDIVNHIVEDINKLVEWASKWQMNFNVNKCSAMHIEHNIHGNNIA